MNMANRTVLLIVALLCGIGCRGGNVGLRLIPSPRIVHEREGICRLRPGVTISLSGDERLRPVAEYLSEKLSPAGLAPRIRKRGRTDVTMRIAELADTTAGAYTLDVTPDGIRIEANDYGGVVSAVSTLRQLLPEQIEREQPSDAGGDWSLPCVSVVDAPRFGYRGLMLDVARHYFDKREVMRLLDRMALYKLNKFHWHLTDNEGWRVEIRRYPELAEKGGWRPFNAMDEFLENKAEKDRDPDLRLTRAHIRTVGGERLYGGYYTQDDIREVVAYAAKLGIDVIPEVDMPGHFNAASGQFPWVICPGADMSSSPVCVGNDAAIEFCKNVYAEIFELFPYEYVHLGADEVGKQNWQRCPLCRKRIADENLLDETGLQSWFVHTMERFFNEHGKRLIGWDEITEGGLSQTATIMWWLGDPKTVLEAAAHGNAVIATPNQWMYFDHGQSNGSIRRVFDFDPMPAGLPEKDRRLVLGAQGNIWGEYIGSVPRMEYMSMPKMLCLSEVCWADPENKDWRLFERKIEAQLPRLDAMGVNYRVPYMESDLFNSGRRVVYLNVPPEEWLCDTIVLPAGRKRIDLQAPWPGIEIRYTTDGTIPTPASALYRGPFDVAAPCEYLFATFRPDGSRSEFRKVCFVKGAFAPADTGASVSGTGLLAVRHDYAGDSCARIESAPVLGEYRTERVAVPGETGREQAAFVYTGYFDAPADSVYTFVLNSIDGAQFYLDGRLAIDQDGRHWNWTERVTQKALRKGLHPLKVLYFCRPRETWDKIHVLELKTTDRKGLKTDFPASYFKH